MVRSDFDRLIDILFSLYSYLLLFFTIFSKSVLGLSSYTSANNDIGQKNSFPRREDEKWITLSTIIPGSSISLAENSSREAIPF